MTKWALFTTCAVWLMTVGCDRAPTPAPTAPPPAAGATTDRRPNAPAAKAADRTLVLRVVHGETGAPLANATVTLEAIDAEAEIGRNTRPETSTLTPDADGRVTIHLAELRPEFFRITAKAPGLAGRRLFAEMPTGRDYTPQPGVTAASLTNLPAEYTLRLPVSKPIGGVVVDDNGQPLAGAKVTFGAFWEPPDGQGVRELAVEPDPVTTGPDGRWSAEAEHDERSTIYPEIALDGYVNAKGNSVSSVGLQTGEHKTVLTRGQTLLVRVIDPNGRPVANANVRPMLSGSPTQPKQTAADGTARFDNVNLNTPAGYAPEPPAIVARVNGFAVTASAIDPANVDEQGVLTADVRMDPLRPRAVRVVDPDGQGVAGATIHVRGWGGQDYWMNWTRRTNDRGEWVIMQAPHAPMTLQINADGFAARSRAVVPIGSEVTSGDEETLEELAENETFEVTLTRPRIVRGRVIDDATGQPVTNARAIPDQNSDAKQPFLHPQRAIPATDGAFELPIGEETYEGQPATARFGVVADGYLPFTSDVYPADAGTDGPIDVDIRLKKAERVELTLLTPDARPAAGAQVTLHPKGDRFGTSVQNGRIQNHGQRSILSADDAGRVTLELIGADATLVIAHPDGLLVTPAGSAEQVGTAPRTLVAWGRAEGTVTLDGAPAAGVDVSVYLQRMTDGTRPVKGVEMYVSSVTDAEGRIAVDHVPPGRITVAFSKRDDIVVDHTTFTRRADIAPGRTTTLTLGDDSATLTGRVVLPADAMPADAMPQGAVPEDTGRAHVLVGPAGLPLRVFYAEVLGTGTTNPDGTFRLRGLVPGDYAVFLGRYVPTRNPDGSTENVQYRGDAVVTVPPDATAGQTIDLGTIELKRLTPEETAELEREYQEQGE